MIIISKPSLRATLRAMKPQDVEYVPFGMYTDKSVRNAVSIIGLELDRAYSVHIEREARRYTITRNA